MFADDENPYAAPKSDLVEIEHYTDGRDLAWRDGKKLVVRKGAELPDRCIKCNAPAGGYRYSRTLEWVKPIWLVTLFLGLLLFALVYVIVRKKGKITVGLCEVHRRRRTRAIAWGWLSALAGIGAFFVAAAVSREVGAFAIFAGFGLLLGGLIGGMLGAWVLVPTKIDKHYIWLARVSPEYRAEFPWRNE